MRVLLVSFCARACALEPLAPLASQTIWQAGEPINVNVDYDLPAFSLEDAPQHVQNMVGETGMGAFLEADAGTQRLEATSTSRRAFGGGREPDLAASFLATKADRRRENQE